MYQVTTEYLEHDGGSKFYETVLIAEENGPAILIKRYGKIANKMGGGQTILERGDLRSREVERDKILADKRKLRAGKGQYRDAVRPTFGLHKIGGKTPSGKPKLIEEGALIGAIQAHFGASDARAITDYFAITDISGDPDFAVEAQAVIEEEPAAPIERGESWGSW